MSYALNTPCYGCKKADKCVDASVLYGAQTAIHNIGSHRGHLGCGSIDLNCTNKEPDDKKE